MKKCIPTTTGTETENTPGRPTITLQTESNFDKLYKWLDEQTELFTVSELHAKICSFAKKRSKCLLFKMQFNSFHRETWPFEHSLFYGYDKYHITGAMVQEKER